MDKTKKILEVIIMALVENAEDVKIDSRTDEMGVLLTLHLNKEDMGRVIGKEGGTAKALRTILRAIGMTENARVNLKIEEPVESV